MNAWRIAGLTIYKNLYNKLTFELKNNKKYPAMGYTGQYLYITDNGKMKNEGNPCISRIEEKMHWKWVSVLFFCKCNQKKIKHGETMNTSIGNLACISLWREVEWWGTLESHGAATVIVQDTCSHGSRLMLFAFTYFIHQIKKRISFLLEQLLHI